MLLRTRLRSKWSPDTHYICAGTETPPFPYRCPRKVDSTPEKTVPLPLLSSPRVQTKHLLPTPHIQPTHTYPFETSHTHLISSPPPKPPPMPTPLPRTLRPLPPYLQSPIIRMRRRADCLARAFLPSRAVSSPTATSTTVLDPRRRRRLPSIGVSAGGGGGGGVSRNERGQQRSVARRPQRLRLHHDAARGSLLALFLVCARRAFVGLRLRVRVRVGIEVAAAAPVYT